MKLGKVYLIGAGPGDPGLMTIKGKFLLGKADVILYDYLVNKEILSFSKRAKKIAVAQKGKKEYTDQDGINKLLVRWAKKVKTVIRLKGGDPFIFSRGIEEALYLEKMGIPYEVVPGITSGFAACEYIKLPITIRNLVNYVTLITGHNAKDSKGINYRAVAHLDGTLIFYMAVGNLKKITDNLIKAGLSKNTPCCIIQDATLPTQRQLISTLQNINKEVIDLNIKPPSVFVVSKTVSLYKSMNSLPLKAKTVLVTRPIERLSQLSEPLEELGARVIKLPTIKISRRPNIKIDKLENFDWIVFMSQTAADIFLKRIKKIPKKLKIACVGAETANLVKKKGLRVNLIPVEFSSYGLIKKFNKMDLRDQRILVFCSDKSNNILVKFLRRKAKLIKENILYRITSPKIDRIKILKDHFDLIIFTSSESVKNFALACGASIKNIAKGAMFASIGPVTSDSIRRLGFKPRIEAKEYTIKGLIKAIKEYFQHG